MGRGEARLNDASARKRLIRLTNTAIFEQLQPSGFQVRRGSKSFRDYPRLDLAEHIYLEFCANGTHATWSDWVDYVPWLSVVHEHVHGLILTCFGSTGITETYRSTAQQFLNQIALHALNEWSVLTDADVPRVAGRIVDAVAGAGIAFARSVQTLDDLIVYLEARPHANRVQLPAAYAFADRGALLDSVIAYTVLFGPNAQLSYYSNALARFALELYSEREGGLRDRAYYAAIHRADGQKNPVQKRHENDAWRNSAQGLESIVGQVSAQAATAGEHYGFSLRSWESPKVYPYPRLTRPISSDLIGELVLVPVILPDPSPLHLLPFAGVTYEPAQRLYHRLGSPAARVWNALPWTILVPLHALSGRPVSTSVRPDSGDLAGAIGSILTEVEHFAIPWMQRFTDIDILVNTLEPLSVDPEIAYLRACTLAVSGDISGAYRQMDDVIVQFRRANLSQLERPRLEEAELFAARLEQIIQAVEILNMQ